MSIISVGIVFVSTFNRVLFVLSAENSLVTSRKQSALKVLTNTVQSSKKSDGKGAKQLKVLPMKRFETDKKSRSPFKNWNYDTKDEFDHTGCKAKGKGIIFYGKLGFQLCMANRMFVLYISVILLQINTNPIGTLSYTLHTDIF